MSKLRSLLKTSFYKLSIGVILIGIGAGVASYLLHETVYLTALYLGTFKTFNFTTLIISLAFALTSFFLTKYLFKDTNGSGIPQVKLALVAYKGKMPKRMPFGKFVTTFLTLCSGLSFGKEGPMVTIGAAWAHFVSHYMKLNRQMTKVLVSSGATAGLAAAFNTPIAAVVFTIEEVLGELNTKYLGPIIVTSVLASVTSYKLLGNQSTFVPLHYQFTIEWHLVFYLMLGFFMSLLGLLFTKSIIISKKIRNKYFKDYEFLFVAVAIIFAACFSQYTPEVLGDGIYTMNKLLLGSIDHPLHVLIFILIMKFILTSSSYSSGLSGGIFMPVLFLGAVGGAIFGLSLSSIGIEKIDVGAFALLGMTSLLVAVIRTPFTAFVMLFEMTRNYELILPLMISSIVAYKISMLFDPESVYESVAEYEGIHLPTISDNESLNDMTVEECMQTKVFTLNFDTLIDDYSEVVEGHDFGGYPVLKNHRLMGVVNRCDIQRKLRSKQSGGVKVKDLLKYTTIYIYPDQSLLIALDRMKRFELGRLPVVSRFNDKQLLGIITPEDIVKYLGIHREEQELQEIES